MAHATVSVRSLTKRRRLILACVDATILLGTVAIEPNRWGLARPGGAPLVRASEWLAPAANAGFDGFELWERHATDATHSELAAILGGPLPVTIFSAYASWDEEEDNARSTVATWVGRTRASGVKFNVGADHDSVDDYAARLRRWSNVVPPGVRLICECHSGTVAEDPRVAARIFELAGPPERMQALVHLGDDPELIRAKFKHHGDRITHVHVNFLEGLNAPRLSDIKTRVRERIDLLGELGFEGTWTIEFAHGLGTENDEPGYTFASAAADLSLLRELLT